MTAKGFSETDIGAVPVTIEFRDISNINRMKEKMGISGIIIDYTEFSNLKE